jgi:truncated hemoglobin YjbI
MDDSSESLFSRIGGKAGLTRLIDQHYEQILADDYLGEYFMGVDIDRLKAAQLTFLRKTFGDTEAAAFGVSLHEAHKGQLVTEHAFDQFVDTFIAVARDGGIDEADQAEIRAVLKAQRASVITEFKPNPAFDYPSKPF